MAFEKSISAGICLENNHGELLMVRQRESKRWGIPAGSMESGEMIQETMYRELWEEAGVRKREVTNLELLGTYTNPRKGHTSLGIVFCGKTTKSTEFRAWDPDKDIEEISFFNRDKVLSLLRGEIPIYRVDFNYGVLCDWFEGRRNVFR